jgi:hypothetical protein
MSLDLTKLERRRSLADGSMRARCPACAEKGQDKKGEHLRVYPDGRFGCCVFPRDREHRKRIFTLAGERSRQSIKVRVAAAKSAGPVQSGILGRLGRVFPVPASCPVVRDTRDGVNKVQARSVAKEFPGTPGTGFAKSKHDAGEQQRLPLPETGDSGTAGTGFEYSRVYVETVPLEEGEYVSTHKGFGEGVPGVPERHAAEPPLDDAGRHVGDPIR